MDARWSLLFQSLGCERPVSPVEGAFVFAIDDCQVTAEFPGSGHALVYGEVACDTLDRWALLALARLSLTWSVSEYVGAGVHPEKDNVVVVHASVRLSSEPHSDVSAVVVMMRRVASALRVVGERFRR